MNTSSTSVKNFLKMERTFRIIPVILASLISLAHGYHVTMQPLPGKVQSAGGRDAAILIIPERGMAHTDYKVFTRIVQQIYPLRLWISLVDTSKEAALTLDNLPLLLAEAIQDLTDNGMDSDADMFLAAHGQTGHLAADYAQAVPFTLRGLILLGTFLPKRFKVESFPLPVLTIVGEIDGVTRITRIAQTIQAMVDADKFDPQVVKQSPLILLEGSNHDVFTIGNLPLSLHILDIEAEVDKTVAMETASNMTAMFIANVLQEPKSFVDMAVQEFQRLFEKAKNLTEPIRAMGQITQDNLKSYWVKSAQKWLSGLQGKDSTQLEVDSYVVSDRGSIDLPPTVVTEHGINYVITFSDVVRSPENKDDNMMEVDNGIFPQSANEIAARMMGPERIQKYLKNTSIAQNYTCKDLNYASFMTAYHSASERARKRYDSYHRGIIFEPDVTTNSEALWEATRLKAETISKVLHVTSISYKTENDESLTQYAGLFFCKLLPPDRALEWIYVDSLRRSMPVPEAH